MPRQGACLIAAVMLVTVTMPGRADAAQNPSIQVEGVIEQIQGGETVPGAVGPGAEATSLTQRPADHTDHEDTYVLRLDSGARVPLDPAVARDLPNGSTVRLTTVVPEAEAMRLASARRVDSSGKPVVVSRKDVVIAKRQPAPNGSALSRAVVSHGLAGGKALTARSVTILAKGTEGYRRATHQVHIVSVVPKGVNAAPVSGPTLRAQVAATSQYWSQQSDGGVTFSVAQVGASYTSAYRCGEDVFRFWNEAANRLRYREGANKHLVIVFPRAALASRCDYGLASVGSGVNAGGVALVSDTTWPVLAHEMGHNLGLGHAKVLRSRSQDVNLGSIPSGSRITDYGDPYDVMAASAPDRAGMLSTVQAANVGLMQAPALTEVRSGTRKVTLSPLSSMRGVRGVKATDPVTGEEYFVEYRTRSGLDARLYRNMAAGVRVLKTDPTEHESRGSVVMDATPSTSDADLAWGIPAAKTFTSRSGALRITVGAQSGTSATVTVAVSARHPAAGARSKGRTTR